MTKWTVLALTLALACSASAVTPVVFTLTTTNLSNGWQVTGTITTDGSTGYLSAANIIDWNLQIVQTTDMVWTQRNSNDLNISGVSTDGNKIYVRTSPDGISDGGTLYVGRGNGRYNIPTNAVICEFTQLSYNLGYGMGGIAGWQDPINGLNYVGLNQLYNTQYPAASLLRGRTNTFQINVPTIATNPLLETMFGTITTDGTIGTLQPRNIVAWNITARMQDIRYMTRANSSVLSLTGVSSTGTVLQVDHAGGQFQIGVGGRRPTYVTVADFTDASYPNGFANYYVGIYGEMGNKNPLVAPAARYYVAARH